jgi:hypothetical protein
VVVPVQPRLRLVLSAPLPEAPSATRNPSRSLRSRRRVRPLRSAVLALTALVALFAAAFVTASLRLDPQLEASAVGEPPLSSVDGSRQGVPRDLALSVQPARSRRFAWAPVAGASGYRVELFRGDSLVFAAKTDRPEITFPAKWKFDRRVSQGEPLAYRWYVWSIVSGQRTTRAIVQARLVVQDR